VDNHSESFYTFARAKDQIMPVYVVEKRKNVS